MAVRTFVAFADLADQYAVNMLLAKLPGGGGEQIRASFPSLLMERRNGHAHAYFEPSRSAVHILSDSGYLVCCVAADVTPEQAALIAVECESIKEWTGKTFDAAVERALGPEYRPLH